MVMPIFFLIVHRFLQYSLNQYQKADTGQEQAYYTYSLIVLTSKLQV